MLRRLAFGGCYVEPTITDFVQAGAAVLTMIAAFAALFVAIKAPKWAASYAESFRREHAKIDERDRLRMHTLLMLVRGRKQILHPDTVTALNIVDLAFSDEFAVRDAHRSFIRATNGGTSEQIVTNYYALVLAAARSVGLGEHFLSDDLHNGYYPEGLGKLDEAALAEAEQKLAAKAARAEQTQVGRKRKSPSETIAEILGKDA